MVCRSGDELAGDVGRVFPLPLKTGVIDRTGDVIRALLVNSTARQKQFQFNPLHSNSNGGGNPSCNHA